MRNLLSQKDKKTLRNEYKLRVIIISLVFVFFTILVAGGELLPSYFISESKQRAATKHSDIIKESVLIREQEVSRTVLFETKEKLKLLSSDEGNASLKTIFKSIIDNKSNKVRINGIFYNKNHSGKDTEILITGNADAREPLLEFKRLLMGVPQFTDVLLPVSDLASDRDIKFSIKVTGNF